MTNVRVSLVLGKSDTIELGAVQSLGAVNRAYAAGMVAVVRERAGLVEREAAGVRSRPSDSFGRPL